MKLQTLEQLKSLVENYKLQGKRIIWTNGCFDLLHPGHMHSLKKAKEQGDILIIGLDSDDSIKKLKGPSRPIIPERHRILSLEALEFVDHVIVFNFGEAKDILQTIKPHVYVKSGNYTIDTINQPERRVIESYGGEIYLPEGLHGFSTTDIIKRMKSDSIDMESNLFERDDVEFRPLSERISKTGLEIMINPDEIPTPSVNQDAIKSIAIEIKKARDKNKSIVIGFGAHLVKNGLSPILINLMEEGYVTHLATNGASTIHDWEFAFQGRTEEDVREYLEKGQFGIWEETGKYINLAIIAGAANGRGYGESISKMIHKDEITLPDNGNYLKSTINNLRTRDFKPGDEITIIHPHKKDSFQEASFRTNTQYTVHPHLGHDIIDTHPLRDGASVGVTALDIDHPKFVSSISNLEGGVYLSIGSAVMSPQIFEKALSMARNKAHQQGKTIKDFLIAVNDVQDSGYWDWNSPTEPPKDSPAYYMRQCKTFARSGGREMHYVKEDNRVFLTNLYHELKRLDS